MSMYNSADFDEMVLTHLVRSPIVYRKAKKLKLEGDDFLTSFGAGIQAYKQIGETILEMSTEAPIPQNILEIELAEKFENGEITGIEGDVLQDLINTIYTADLKEDYATAHLTGFIKHRRLSKVQQNTAGTVDLYEEMHKVAIELDFSTNVSEIESINPFDRPIFVDETMLRDTGFPGLTEAMGGFQPEECSLLMAASGSGKTSVATNIALAVANSVNVMYLSLEEPTNHLVQRFYANRFELDYSKLRYGSPDEQMLLRTAFADLTAPERAAMRRLRVVDARKQSPINIKAIQDIMENYAVNENFITDTIIIDQMDYMSPAKALPKGTDKWRESEQIAFECDELSMYKIMGRHPISVIIIHQLKGNPKWKYTYDDISGFKGIVKPFDSAIAIGRFDKESEHINLQSLKSRHSAAFTLTYRANFSTMSFTPEDWAPPEELDFVEKVPKRHKTKEKKYDELEAMRNRAAREVR